MVRRRLAALTGVLMAAGSAGVMAAPVGAGGSAPATSAVLAVFHRPVVISGVRNDDVQSSNWSGYAVSSANEFTGADGHWVEPTATCASRSTSYAAFWVGIDGYTSTSVEQLGTDSDCSAGKASYYAWYEMYPANSVMLPISRYPVSPGDTLSGSVIRSGTSYTLSLTDTQSGATRWSFKQAEAGSNANSSAEWVAEAPEVCSVLSCRVAPLTDFGTVTFTGEAAAGSAPLPISSFTADGGPHDMTMVTSGGVTKAAPGALSANGEQFSDTWSHS